MPPSPWVSVEGRTIRKWVSLNLLLRPLGKPWEAHSRIVGHAMRQRAWVRDLPIKQSCTPLKEQTEGCKREGTTCVLCAGHMYTWTLSLHSYHDLPAKSARSSQMGKRKLREAEGLARATQQAGEDAGASASLQPHTVFTALLLSLPREQPGVPGQQFFFHH